MDDVQTSETVEELFRRHAPELRRHAAGLLRAAGTDPDDVLQEVMLRILARHGTAPIALEHPRAWLHVCVRNACLSHLRGTRPAAALDEVLELAGPGSEPADLIDARDETRAVLADLARLEERQRGALLATALGETSYATVARDLGASEASVTALIARARGNLKALRRARQTPCDDVRALVDEAARRQARSSELVRRHLATCGGCRTYADDRRGRRSGRGRLAGWLAPVHGLFAHLGTRAADLLVPVGIESQVAHGIAVLAVALAATGPQVAPDAGRPAAPSQAVAAAPAPRALASTATPVSAIPSPGRRTASGSGATTGTSPDREPLLARAGTDRRSASDNARPAELNLFGCPKIQGRATAEDNACRRRNRRSVRAQIDARLARHAAAREAAAAEAPAAPPATPAPQSPATPVVPEAPPATPEPAPEPTATPAPTATPEPGATPEPVAEPVVTATPDPGTPEPAA